MDSCGSQSRSFIPLVLQHTARALHRLGLELERRKAVSRVLRRGAWTVGVCLSLFLLLLLQLIFQVQSRHASIYSTT